MIYGVVPLKELRLAKSRLEGFLSEEQRVELSRDLLANTVEALKRTSVIERVFLVTVERELCGTLGAEWMPDSGDLNRSLAEAQSEASRQGAKGLLIVPADLPYIDGQAISAFLIPWERADVIVNGTLDGGTGALFCAPPAAISPAFGPQSREKHLRAARRKGLNAVETDIPALGFDLDSFEDINGVLADPKGNRLRALLGMDDAAARTAL